MSVKTYKDLTIPVPLHAETVEAFSLSLPKLLVFVNDKFLLENRFVCDGACSNVELIKSFNRDFGELLLGIYSFSLYEHLADEFTGQIAALAGRGITRAAVESLLKAWTLAVQCLVKRPAADHLIPPIEWLHHNLQVVYEHLDEDPLPLDEPLRQYFDLLLAKNRKFAAEYVLSHIRNGFTIENVYASVLLPVLQRIRLLWKKNALSAADAHTAEDICRYVILRVVDSVFGERRYPFKALVACMQGEENMLSAEVFANFLEIKGWAVSFIGHDAPDEDILHAMITNNPQVFVLSASSISRLPAAKSLIPKVRRDLPQIKIVAEGRAVMFAQNDFKDLTDALISGFEDGHKTMLELVIPHA
jgi:methanogenic corrinoid protein MtbC1